MRRSLNKRLDDVATIVSGDSLSTAAVAILVTCYAKSHALFLQFRSHVNSWPEISRLRRGYTSGTIGISGAVSGQRNWVSGHDGRHELEAAGLAIAVKGLAETTGLCLTLKGRGFAWSLCRELLPSTMFSGAMSEHLAEMPPCRIRGNEHWVSESKLFNRACEGDTADWQSLIDMMLEPAISGCVESTGDVQGRVFYRYLKPFVELPVVEIESSPLAEDVYLSAWHSELARLRNLDSVDGEIVIPLSVT